MCCTDVKTSSKASFFFFKAERKIIYYIRIRFSTVVESFYIRRFSLIFFCFHLARFSRTDISNSPKYWKRRTNTRPKRRCWSKTNNRRPDITTIPPSRPCRQKVTYNQYITTTILKEKKKMIKTFSLLRLWLSDFVFVFFFLLVQTGTTKQRARRVHKIFFSGITSAVSYLYDTIYFNYNKYYNN